MVCIILHSYIVCMDQTLILPFYPGLGQNPIPSIYLFTADYLISTVMRVQSLLPLGKKICDRLLFYFALIFVLTA